MTSDKVEIQFVMSDNKYKTITGPCVTEAFSYQWVLGTLMIYRYTKEGRFSYTRWYYGGMFKNGMPLWMCDPVYGRLDCAEYGQYTHLDGAKMDSLRFTPKTITMVWTSKVGRFKNIWDLTKPWTRDGPHKTVEPIEEFE